MKKVYHELFPIPLLYVENFLNTKEIALAKNFVINNLDMCEDTDSIYNGISSYKLSDHFSVLDELQKQFSEWSFIKERLLENLLDFSNYSSIKFEKLQNSWFNIQQKFSILRRHNHVPGSNISGALYIDVSSNSSTITFYDNFNNKNSVFSNKSSKFSFQNYTFIPNEGDLIIFPSYLDHGSDDLNFYEKRTVISFNAA